MRLLFFNRSFHPDVEASGQLLSELCQDLRREHEVTVVAGRPYNMARFGSWRPVKREQWSGVHVLRAYNPRLNKGRFAARVVNLLSYFCFSFVAGFMVRRPDVVVVETDPPVLGLVGWFFARLYRAKFVFYVQNLYPDVGVALGKLRNPLLIRALDTVTRLALRAADRVVVLGEDMRRRILAKQSCPADKLEIIPNWVDTRVVQPRERDSDFRRRHGLHGKFVVMFSGNHGLSQGLDEVLDVAASVADEPDVRFLFVGDGAAKAGLMAKAAALGLRHVMFLPYQPQEALSESLTAADVHLLPLRRGLAGLSVPSKVYGIMAAGRAFIAAVDWESEVAQIIREHRCGIQVAPDSPAQLKAAILWGAHHPELLRQMGQRGREVAERYYDRRLSVGKFDEMLRALTTPVRSSRFSVRLGDSAPPPQPDLQRRGLDSIRGCAHAARVLDARR